MFHAVYQVHTEQTGNQRGEHQDNADAGEHFHDAAYIIINNTGVSVHCRVKDVVIDVTGLAGLTHLDIDVLDHVGIQLIDGQFELQLRQQVLVATDRSYKVGQAVLQAAQ